jgi:hypothetical protein
MAINHIPSDLRAYTDHIFGFVSAAEGFVFLSGLMAGYVYARKFFRNGFEAARRACVQRTTVIYRYHLGAYIAVFAGVVAFGFGHGVFPENTPEEFVAHPWLSLLLGPLLVLQPSLFDILPLYCVLLLATPWILRACAEGRRGWILLGSFQLWALTNFFSPQTPFLYGPVNTGAFNLGAWQLLFVVGAVFGFNWAEKERDASYAIGAKNASPNTPNTKSPAHAVPAGNEDHDNARARPAEAAYVLPTPPAGVLAALLGVAVFLYAMRHALIDTGLPQSAIDWLANKNNLAPLRLLNDTILFYLVYMAVSRFPRVISWRPLAWLGQASITVFAVHVVTAYVIQAHPETFSETASGRTLGTTIMLAALFLGAGLHKLFAGLPKHARKPQPLVPAHAPTPAFPSVAHAHRPPPAYAVHARQRREHRSHQRHESRASGAADPVHRRG